MLSTIPLIPATTWGSACSCEYTDGNGEDLLTTLAVLYPVRAERCLARQARARQSAIIEQPHLDDDCLVCGIWVALLIVIIFGGS